MIRCIIKANNYPSHFRVFRFSDTGREVIVDPKAEVDVDDEGEPLVLTEKTFEYLREESGRALKFEPVGASDIEHEAHEMLGDLGAARDRIAELERDNFELVDRVIKAETDLEKAKAETITVRAELNTAGLRIAELEGNGPKEPAEAKPEAKHGKKADK